MSANPPLTLSIDTLAFGGEGIGRAEGRVYFVPFTAPGDEVEVRVTTLKKNFGRAEVVRVVKAGPARQAAPCPYYGPCGGCQYQHLTYEEELRAKQAQVAETLRRVGKVEAPVDPIVPSPQAYGYRNRITVHAGQGRLGFHRAGSREIVDVAHCLLAAPEVNDALTDLRRKKPRPAEGHFSLRMPDLPPSAFHQVNRFLLEPLRDLVAAQAAATDAPHLVEGYCGGGFFTEALAAGRARAWAIEADGRALRDARRRQLPQVEWIEGKVEDRLAEALAAAASAPALVLLDPPREGLAPGALEALRAGASGVARAVYVSCDPATLARDLAGLSSVFRVERVVPVDLFPRTAQVEAVAVLAPV
ncbi:MAG: TRAM domain-containing protein [Verrucomicrobium sp.]|nr:TRAM domain-containing protein [Verrucomicrobium sp.]